jgi:hypothetical protein
MSQRPVTRTANKEKHPGLVVAKGTRRSSADVAAEKAKKAAALEKKKTVVADNIKRLAQMEAIQEKKDADDAETAARPPKQVVRKRAPAKSTTEAAEMPTGNTLV